MSDDPSSSFPTWPTVPTTAYVACTAPWKQYKDHCYFVQSLTLGSDGLWLAWTFDDAESQCESRNARLVSIHSDEENDFVNGLITTHGIINQTQMIPEGMGACGYACAWIGLQLFPDNTTAWTDGTPVDYHKGLYPGPEKYVFGMLHDESCEIDWEGWGTMAISARYICKKGLNWLH
ncbi:unnamed protein product, partial [Mesorhabditis spiculigera]